MDKEVVIRESKNSRYSGSTSNSVVMPTLSANSRLNISYESPGKARKRKMALPRRIVRLLESSKRLQYQNVSLSKKRQMCIKKFIPESKPSRHSDIQSSHVVSCQKTYSTAACLSVDLKLSAGGERGISCKQPLVCNYSTNDEHSFQECGTDEEEYESTPKCASECQKNVLAVDCEMVGVGPKGRYSALGRCSIVDYEGRILFDEYVKPDQDVTDYRTRWSGIRARNMVDALSFAKAKELVKNIIKDKIVVGHAVFNDFRALKLSHPPEDIRDTSACRLLVELVGKQCKRGQHPSLKALAKQLLKLEIQKGEHSSVEDASVTMKLYKLVEKKWEQQLQSAFPDQQFRTSFLDDHFWPDDL